MGALVHAFDNWRRCLDDQRTCYIYVALIDFCKAFDKLQPVILKEILHHQFNMNSNLVNLAEILSQGGSRSSDIMKKDPSPCL